MIRLPDWPARLHDFVDSVKASPFAWTFHDCLCGWTADAALAMTGEDIAAGYRGKYKTAAGAARLLKNAGFSNLADAVGSKLPEIHISRARIGDIAAIPDDSPFGYTLGIVNGEMILVLGEHQMGLVPLFDAKRAFAVG
jgi:hypothetical protein